MAGSGYPRPMVRPGSLVFGSLALILAFAPACSDDTVDANEQAGDGDGDASGDGDGDPSGDGDGDEPIVLGGPARGLSLTSIEINQGTGVDVVRDGQVVPVEQRYAMMIRDRDTLVRVQHVIDDPAAWFPRSITAILHIQPPDGEELTRSRSFVISEDSDPRQLDSGFYFSLFAAEARPGTEIWVELRESDASVDVSGLGEGLTVSPTSPTGFIDTALAIHVVFVPVRYEHPDPVRTPDITPEDLQLFHDQLLQTNPAQTIDFQVRAEPLVWTNQLTNLGSLLEPTRAIKLEDGAAANVYYHALVDVGGPGVSKVAGIAWLTGDDKSDSASRVAATVYYKQVHIPDEEDEDQTIKISPPVQSSRTFVHEIGHNQGFSHIECPNADAAGPDPSYPHEDGLIGAYGFGIRDFHIYTPGASHDYMTYCGNAWVSDWTWNKAIARIETLTAWDFEQAGPAPVLEPILVGLLGPDGFEEWTVSSGIAPHAGAETEWIEYEIDGARTRVLATIDRLSDDQTILVTAGLPHELPALDAITWIRADRQQSVDISRVQAH
jgi:hypothetical protein